MQTELDTTQSDDRPAAGTWTIDAVHSVVSFTVEHFTVAVARGIAAGPTGTITIGDDLAASSVTASIEAGTLTTANALRDAKIHGPDVLDVEHFPTIEFVSKALRLEGGASRLLDGELTLRGVTRPLTLEVTYRGTVTDIWSKERMGMTVVADIRRSDFGAGEWGHVALTSGGFMVPDEVRVTMEIEATLDLAESGAAPA